MIWPNLGGFAFTGPVDPSSRVDLSQHEFVWMLVRPGVNNPTPLTTCMDCMPYEEMPELYNTIAPNGSILTRGLSRDDSESLFFFLHAVRHFLSWLENHPVVNCSILVERHEENNRPWKRYCLKIGPFAPLGVDTESCLLHNAHFWYLLHNQYADWIFMYTKNQDNPSFVFPDPKLFPNIFTKKMLPVLLRLIRDTRIPQEEGKCLAFDITKDNIQMFRKDYANLKSALDFFVDSEDEDAENWAIEDRNNDERFRDITRKIGRITNKYNSFIGNQKSDTTRELTRELIMQRERQNQTNITSFFSAKSKKAMK